MQAYPHCLYLTSDHTVTTCGPIDMKTVIWFVFPATVLCLLNITAIKWIEQIMKDMLQLHVVDNSQLITTCFSHLVILICKEILFFSKNNDLIGCRSVLELIKKVLK